MGCVPSADKGRESARVLILGIQSSGKSTFAKQMKIIHCNGFRDDEISNYKDILCQNLMLGFKELLDIIEDDVSKDNKKHEKFFTKSNPYDTELTSKTVEAAESLWEDDAIQALIKKTSTRPLEYFETLKYLMSKGVERLIDPDFFPDNEDILHIRQRTTGISETKFTAFSYDWTFIDVGGQKVERRKWVHTQQNLTAVIHFVSIVDYDVISEDDPTKTRMEESIDVWKDIAKGEALADLPIILFFNKIDLLPQKLKSSPLKKVFKDYKGGSTPENAQRYIMEKYLKALGNDATIEAESIKTHFICALDTENMRIVFKDILDHIFKQRLEKSGI